MKLAYVDLCGFRGYQKQLRIEFPDGFIVIDGRNGVGKSTIFDAIEFGLTGTITKYGDATADRETIADYIWWTGEGSPLRNGTLKSVSTTVMTSSASGGPNSPRPIQAPWTL